MQIEQIEDWTGHDIVDREDEKVGKLQDVYYQRGESEAVLACVKAGLFGRKLYAVPLAGAQATRDHIRLAFTKAQVEAGPQVDGEESLTDSDRQAIGSHYEAELAPGDFESATGRKAREAKTRALDAQIDELDARAASKRDQAKRDQDQAQSNAREAEDLEAQRRRLEE